MKMQGRSFYEESSERNWTPLVFAGLASIVIHLLLYFRVSDMRFDVTAQIPEKLRNTPARKLVNFERLKSDPVSNGEWTSHDVNGVAVNAESMRESDLSQILDVAPIAFAAPPLQPSAIEAGTVEMSSPPQETDVPPPVWQPRQEVIAIAERIVRDEAALLPRREIYAIERIPTAPDFAPASPPIAARLASPQAVADIVDSISAQAVPPPPDPVSIPQNDTMVTAPEIAPEVTLSEYSEQPSQISQFRHVDDRLSAFLSVYSPPHDSRKYFRLEIIPSVSAYLPIVGKDIVFVQDASRSMARERLYFCKEGLKEALAFVSPADRFNIVSFRDTATFCFGQNWARPSRENFERALGFINDMDSRGDTDLFKSLKSLLDLPRDSARPMIAIVITDGKATMGITGSTRIIGEFSKLNDNVSLYVIGTHAKANAYLLDMLAFCNRGRQDVVRSDRWAIPDAVKALAASCAYPVLGRIRVEADISSGAEFFPLPSANLYAGEPLVYYGSCPATSHEMTLQLRGEGGTAKIDSIMSLDFSKAKPAGPELRSEWARRKMHSLLGDYARNPSQALKAEMRALGASTGEPIPYLGEF